MTEVFTSATGYLASDFSPQKILLGNKEKHSFDKENQTICFYCVSFHITSWSRITHTSLASRYNGDSFVVTLRLDVMTQALLDGELTLDCTMNHFKLFKYIFNYMSIFLAEIFLPKRLTKKHFMLLAVHISRPTQNLWSQNCPHASPYHELHLTFAYLSNICLMIILSSADSSCSITSTPW